MTQRTLVLLIFIISLILRLAHNFFYLDSPLYDFPLGGHTVYFNMAKEIYEGNFIPFSSSFTINSPYYPYFLSFFYKIFGFENFLLVRLFNIFLDSLTSVLIFYIGKNYFNYSTATISAILYSICGVAIYYAIELDPTSIILFLLSFSVYLYSIYKKTSIFLVGFLCGLATGFRPNLILVIIGFSLYELFINKSFKQAFFLLITFFITISPISIINYKNTSDFILLTASGGHNFYIAHNEQATAGYSVPPEMDGDIFASYKNKAILEENKELSDKEVSLYYKNKAFEYIINNPIQELKLCLKRIKLFFSSYELGTYSSYYYHQEISKLLKILPSIFLISSLCIIGIVASLKNKRSYIVLVPIMASLISVTMFFFISRLRIPALPFLAVFAGYGVYVTFKYLKEKKSLGLLCVLIISIWSYLVVYPKNLKFNTNNEWNKVGVVYMILNQKENAKIIFENILKNDPSDKNALLNLKKLDSVK